jgi:uncharacterized protein
MGNARDEPGIAEIIRTIVRGVDLHLWDLVRHAFGREVTLDYGEPERLARDDIVARWRPLFEGFDETRHEVHDIASDVKGDRATATARFDARHVLRGARGGDEWRLTGSYEFALERAEGGWRVTAMRMIPGESTGNATLPEQALAKRGTPSLTTR